MISTSSGIRASLRCLIAVALFAPGSTRAASSAGGQGGIAALAASTPVIGGSGMPAPAAAPASVQSECAAGVPDSCYEQGPAQFVNVGSFFDRLQRPATTHFMVKYFEPRAAVRTQLVGFSFVSNRTVTYAAAGAVITSRDTPFFPTTAQLRALPHLRIAAAFGRPTCVDLAGDGLVLESNQAAWLILQFSDPLDTNFTGVKADADATDHPCDFMTRDSGDLWYRPDPDQTKLDWEFKPFSVVLPSKQQVLWTQIKTLYR